MFYTCWFIEITRATPPKVVIATLYNKACTPFPPTPETPEIAAPDTFGELHIILTLAERVH